MYWNERIEQTIASDLNYIRNWCFVNKKKARYVHARIGLLGWRATASRVSRLLLRDDVVAFVVRDSCAAF
jgi:hypothetical protein